MKTHKIIKEAIPTELANFIYQSFLNKRKVERHLFETRYKSTFKD